jgi:FtsH-binding integral membrane protein
VVVAAAAGHVRDPPRRGLAYRKAALALLTQAQREQRASFINKATGWFTVSLGAARLATYETWHLVSHQRWPAWLFWLLIVVMLGTSVLNTALRMIRDSQDPAGDRSTPAEA